VVYLERRQLVGVFLVSTNSLALEVVLTRVFSVTMWYHFAFLAISMALMGSAVAGITLYFFPGLSQPQPARRWIGMAALALALAVPLTFFLYLRIPFRVTLGRGTVPLREIGAFVLIYLDLTLPFFLSGLVLSLSLAAWPEQAGQIYWADLSGAAAGCLFSIATLEWLGGSGAVLAVGVAAALAALVFAWGSGRRQRLAFALVLATLALVLGNTNHNWIAISVNKSGSQEAPRLYERWNAHSRVTVYEVAHYPFFWSVDLDDWNKIVQEGRFLNHALLLIDAVAGTPIQEFRGLLHEEEFLRYDLSSLVYHVIEQPTTLVIGPGGGRDVLAALASGAPHVTAVEVNAVVVEAVRGRFADFSGHLYDRPDVMIVVDDARGYITRSPERYDVIQASLIDTWAAGGSGAFALSENSLYTVEAFKTYYDHLTEQGMLSVSRWYLTERPAETMRLVSTAMAGWESAGVADPRRHVAVVARPNASGQSEGMATALFKRTPFTPGEVKALQAKALELGCVVLYAPGFPPWEDVGRFVEAQDHAAWVAGYPLDVSPATDDRPFFFNLVRFGQLIDSSLSASGVYRTSMEAIVILAAVIGVMAVMTVLFIVLPLWLGARRRGLAHPSIQLIVYFAGLGLAFMLVEVPTVQRLTVYLGRPVYSLAVVLFSLLLFSGLGSLWSGRHATRLARLARWLFPALMILVILHAWVGDWVVNETIGQPFPLRLLVTLVRLAPLGFLMGMPFPLAMRWAGVHRPGVVPWLWGINGVMSVLGSAFALASSIHIGFRLTLLSAAAVYGLAALMLVWEERALAR
jgi:spermidine synthase